MGKGQVIALGVLAFAGGYALGAYQSPIQSIPRDSSGRPLSANAASAFLQVCEICPRVRPQLEEMADGKTPSPADLLRLANALT